MSSDADGRERDRERMRRDEALADYVAKKRDDDRRCVNTMGWWSREEAISEGGFSCPSYQDIGALAREVLRLGEAQKGAENRTDALSKELYDRTQHEARQRNALERRTLDSIEALREAQTELYDSLADPAQPIQQGARIEGEEYEAVRKAVALRWEEGRDAWRALVDKLPPGASLIVQPPEQPSAEGGRDVGNGDSGGGGSGDAGRGRALDRDGNGDGSRQVEVATPTAPEDAEREVFELMEHYYNEGRGGGPAPSPSDAREEVERIARAAWNRRTPSEPVDAERERLVRWVESLASEVLESPDDWVDEAHEMLSRAASALRSQGGQEPVAFAVESNKMGARGEVIGREVDGLFVTRESAAEDVQLYPPVYAATLVPLYRHPVREDAGREREEAVERVAKALWDAAEVANATAYAMFRGGVGVNPYRVTPWNPRLLRRDEYLDRARRLLSECFPSPDQGAEP